ncbi:uncharacterized protein [Lolium perenne]|uniref:uncharacterized protein isoform X1 n=1 Tax=Lolium perenne TaxID=4522 RepID=UPI0021F69CEE|nr:uncharacterized protein LOC127318579 isoform X1 [Lolium perenne]
MRAGGAVRLAYSRGSGAGGEGGGCSTSRCGPVLPSFSRLGGGPGTDLEPHGLPTSSDDDDDSSASTVSREDDDGDGALEGVKEDRWVQRPRPTRNPVLGSAGECQDQRHPLGALLTSHARKDRKQRTASLDLGCPGGVHGSSTNSPGFFVSGVGAMNKGLGVSPQSRSGVLTSPGTLSYNRRGTAVAGYQQGWTSERVPLPSNGHIRHPGGGSMALPYNNGRVLPSKWEDAERWIFSPNPHDALSRNSVPQHRRPKSKSGPLGPPGRFGAPYSSVSSSTLLLDSSGVGNQAVHSPFLPGVFLPEHVSGGSSNSGDDRRGASGEDSSNGRGGRSGPANGGYPSVWYTRAHHPLDSSLQSQSLHTSQEYTQDGQVTNDLATSNTPLILRKNVATQTSPDLSRSSSPNTRPSFSRTLSVQQVKEMGSCFSKLEIKDVQMDDRVTLTRWSKKHVSRGSDKNSTNIIEWKRKTMESKSSTWEVTETAKCISKIDTEEAKLTAWESIQKAKAEAAIQKLVIKLEKKRSYSLERIFNTLRSAHRKTQVVRSTTTAKHDQQISRTVKRTSHLNKNGQMSSLSGCFTCQAF